MIAVKPNPPADRDMLDANPIACAAADAPDVELMLRVRAGDGVAFDQLVLRHRPRVFQQLMGLVRHRQDAEDLTQTVFLRVFTQRKTYQPLARFTTWLYTITLNVGRNALRSHARHMRRFRPFSPNASDATCDPRLMLPPEILERRERQWRLGWELKSLPARQKTAIQSYYLDGWPKEMIARRLNTTILAVDSLLRRGRRQLRHKLHRD